MTSAHHALALAVLQRLLLGGYVGGIRFGGIPQLLIDTSPNSHPLSGQVFINLGNTWQVFPTRPSAFPLTIEECTDVGSEDQELEALCALRFAEIVQVELGVDRPDLILSFTDGRVFFLSGAHETFEPWDAGLAFGDPSESWRVHAVPGGELDVSAPDYFRMSVGAR